MAVKVDISRLKAAILKMADVPGKVGSDVLNKSVLQVAIGSGSGKGLVHFTKKATEAAIRADMLQMVTSVSKSGRTKSVPRIILLAAKGLAKRGIRPMGWSKDEQLRWRCEVSQFCEAIMKARVMRRAYIAAGWLWAARDLAQKVPGHKLTRLEPKHLPTKDNGSARLSFSKASTPQTLLSGLYNASKGASVVVTSGMVQLAVNSETKNLQQYFTNQMERAVKRAVKLKPIK